MPMVIRPASLRWGQLRATWAASSTTLGGSTPYFDSSPLVLTCGNGSKRHWQRRGPPSTLPLDPSLPTSLPSSLCRPPPPTCTATGSGSARPEAATARSSLSASCEGWGWVGGWVGESVGWLCRRGASRRGAAFARPLAAGAPWHGGSAAALWAPAHPQQPQPPPCLCAVDRLHHCQVGHALDQGLDLGEVECCDQ
jgi:hypothetical protein